MSCAHFIAGRYENALSWTELAIRGKPLLITMCVSAASAALADRQDKASEAMLLLRELAPKLRLSNVGEVMSFLQPQHSNRWMDGMRKAGLPE